MLGAELELQIARPAAVLLDDHVVVVREGRLAAQREQNQGACRECRSQDPAHPLLLHHRAPLAGSAIGRWSGSRATASDAARCHDDPTEQSVKVSLCVG